MTFLIFENGLNFCECFSEWECGGCMWACQRMWFHSQRSSVDLVEVVKGSRHQNTSASVTWFCAWAMAKWSSVLFCE